MSKPPPPPAAVEAVRTLLRTLGEDPDREGLRDTPRRVYQALAEMTAGRDVDVGALLGVQFDSGSYDQMVVLRGIAFTSTCEHHLLPFTGTAAVAYLPSEGAAGYRVVGLSKLARLVDAFAARLQLQERMTAQVADALVEHLAPRGVAVVLEAEHSCMACRGVRKAGATMLTSALRGVFLDEHDARAEVFALIGRR